MKINWERGSGAEHLHHKIKKNRDRMQIYHILKMK